MNPDPVAECAATVQSKSPTRLSRQLLSASVGQVVQIVDAQVRWGSQRGARSGGDRSAERLRVDSDASTGVWRPRQQQRRSCLDSLGTAHRDAARRCMQLPACGAVTRSCSEQEAAHIERVGQRPRASREQQWGHALVRRLATARHSIRADRKAAATDRAAWLRALVLRRRSQRQAGVHRIEDCSSRWRGRAAHGARD